MYEPNKQKEPKKKYNKIKPNAKRREQTRVMKGREPAKCFFLCTSDAFSGFYRILLYPFVGIFVAFLLCTIRSFGFGCLLFVSFVSKGFGRFRPLHFVCHYAIRSQAHNKIGSRWSPSRWLLDDWEWAEWGRAKVIKWFYNFNEFRAFSVSAETNRAAIRWRNLSMRTTFGKNYLISR